MPSEGAFTRFVHAGEIGRGAMGVVHRVHDRSLGQDVALKRIQSPSAEAVLRFKREFRAVEEIRHANLVRLFELGDDELGAYFTMELVLGEDIATHCRRVGPSAITSLLPQLLDALAALHARGVVHRDLKPANILVSDEGVVKVCDFGMLGRSDDDTRSPVAGSPAYMSPEQTLGLAPTPASDAYALGVVLYELSTGRLPFDGSTDEVLRAHRSKEAPELDAGSRFAPLIRALLSKTPELRPTVSEIRAQLHPEHVSASLPQRPWGPGVLLGREDLERRLAARLDAALLADPVSVTALVGPTGVGKSTLLAWLDERERACGHEVLLGRSHVAERVAFNALDVAIDALSATLQHDAQLLAESERALAVAAAMFPVLALTPRAVRDRDRALVRGRLFGRDDEKQLQRASFDALAGVLTRLAARRPVTLIVDDFQWADDDSLALLTNWIETVSGPLRIVVALRDDTDRGAPARWLWEQGASVLDVEPLSPRHSEDIIRRAARRSDLSDDAVRQAAAACDGRPFFAEVLGLALASGAHTARDPLGALDSIVEALPRDQARSLVSIVVADEPMTLDLLASAASLRVGVILDHVQRLESAGLVRRGRSAATATTVATSHDAVRAAVARVAGAEALASAHEALLRAFSALGDPPPERLVRHLLGAGRVADAAWLARSAAANARERGAHALAADMFEVALRAPGEDSRMLARRRAEALERAGRYREAVDAWGLLARDASRASSSEDVLDVGLHEAHALIAANRTKEGLARLDAALAMAGEGPTLASGLAEAHAAITFAMGPLPWRPARRAARPALVARGRRDAKIGVLLSFLEPLTGLRYLQRARATFSAAGAEELVALTELNFAVLAHVGSASTGIPSLAARWERSALSRVDVATACAEVRGMPPFLAGLGELRRGAWASSKARFAEAAAIFEDADGTTERMMAASWGMMGDVYAQDLPAMKSHVAWFRKRLARAGETIIVAHVELLAAYVHVLDGRHADARATTEALADMFEEEPPNTQRAAALLYMHLPDVYEGDARAARRDFTRALGAAARFRFLDSMYGGPIAGIGALVEVNALRSGDPAASQRRVAKLAAACDRAPPLWAGLADRARAYAADASGDPGRALLHLERAESEAARFARPIDVAIARYQRGRRLGGDEGASLIRHAREQLARLGAHPSLLEEDLGLR